MKLTIHRGRKEIGGSCVELVTAKTRLVLDLSLPLVDDNREPFDSHSASIWDVFSKRYPGGDA